MDNPVGVINGTYARLSKVVNGVLVEIGGATTNASTFNTELLDITNKSSDENTTYQEGAGERSASHTLEVLWSDDEAFESVVQQFVDREQSMYVFTYESNFDKPLDAFTFAIPTFSDSTEKNTPVSSSITFEASGETFIQEQYYFALDSNSDDAVDSNGDVAIARA